MAYIALYRRFRPKNFEGLVGQAHISTTLASAINTGKIAHAYLFSGPRGTGKTSTAKIFAKALNCEHGPTASPCNTCNSCQKINTGSSMDVFEIDAASNRGIDEIRELRETVKFAPVDGRYKVYIIDEVHMLTTEAFNALLKTLEEPPAHVVFILATTESHKVPATIHSRCQRYDFKRITVEEIKGRLAFAVDEMKIEAEPEALRLIAVHADGGMRDALSILDQCSAMDDEKITKEKVRRLLGLVGHEWIWKIVDFLIERNAKEILRLLDGLIAEGKEVHQILSEIVLHMRSVMLYNASGDVAGMDIYSDDFAVLQRHGGKLSHEEIVAIIRKIHGAIAEAKWSAQPRITAEVVLLSLCEIENRQGLNEQVLLEKIERLEERIERIASSSSHVRPREAAGLVSSSPSHDAGDVTMKRAPAQKSAPRSAAPMAVVDENGVKIWDKMLDSLLKTGKRSVYACVSQGWLQSLRDNQMTIAFNAGFPKERTEKSDYRELLERILEEICNVPMAVRCTLERVSAPPKQPKAIKKEVKPEIGANLSVEEKEVIETAVQVFGDHFIKK